MNKNMLARAAVWLVAFLVLMTLFKQCNTNTQNLGGPVTMVAYSEFLGEVNAGHMKEAVLDHSQGSLSTYEVRGVTEDSRSLKAVAPIADEAALVNDLARAKTKVTTIKPEEPSLFASMLPTIIFMLVFFGIYMFILRKQMGGSGGGSALGGFGKSRAKMDPTPPKETFADVAGCDEAKFEVTEIVDFLRDPARFQKLGGRMPRGVLMVGSPGTGKTLMAKAMAGEARVPFFSADGSQFVEMFVGVGAARVRDLFEQAKKHAPCIVFIDEIDAVGKTRGNGIGGGGNDEREQTLNAILVEMDGFETSATPIIVIAATNRADVLDPALVRPGRFDRQVVMPLPDIRGREQILLVHMRKVPIGPSVNVNIIARGTPGMSGADLANLVNEAALFAARRNTKYVEMQDFEDAKDKIIMGAKRKVVMPMEERRNTAYHESGHALIGKLLPKCHPVHKVTIIPRGRALGVTMSLPEEDTFTHGKEFLLSQIAMLFGGRIAEEVFMGQMTTGASSDFERATQLARSMVTKWGMSDIGLMVHSEHEGTFGGTKNVSEATMQKVDAEVNRILDEQYTLARKLIEENRDKIEAMTKALLEWETIDADQIDDIMAGLAPRPPKVPLPTEPPKQDGGSAPDTVPQDPSPEGEK